MLFHNISLQHYVEPAGPEFGIRYRLLLSKVFLSALLSILSENQKKMIPMTFQQIIDEIETHVLKEFFETWRFYLLDYYSVILAQKFDKRHRCPRSIESLKLEQKPIVVIYKR